MEAEEARLKRERRESDKPWQTRHQVVANLAEEWDKPDFTLESEANRRPTTAAMHSGPACASFHRISVSE